MSTRRCSVIYLVPYIHSDNSRRRRYRGRTAAVLYEEQCSSPTSILHPPNACLQRGARVIMITMISVLKYIFNFVVEFLQWVLTCLLPSRYTGSYNYGSYANQHPHSIQSQYPSLAHEPAIPAPLHYSAYHRSSAQVSPSHPRTGVQYCSI